MTKRKAAQAALKRLWKIDAALSEDDEIPANADGEPTQEEDKNSQPSSDSETSEFTSDSIEEDEEPQATGATSSKSRPYSASRISSSAIVSCSTSSSSSASASHHLRLCGKDGIMWKIVNSNSTSQVGRKTAESVFTVTPGIKTFARNKTDTPLSAWRLLMSDNIMKLIQKHTTDKAVSVGDDLNLTLDELDSFIGVIYLRGIINLRKAPIRTIWSKDFGCHYIQQVMCGNRFCTILRFLRFDDANSRRQRVSSDLFAPIREVFDLFVANCLQVYTPHPFLTIDEQLLPLKNRCAFIQYMKNKPDKFGIKYWICADVQTKFCINMLPYLGAHDKDARQGDRLGDYVVKSLMDPFLKKGYNVTVDNFFTSLSLAHFLLNNKTTLVGTVRANCRFLSTIHLEKKSLYASQFFSDEKRSYDGGVPIQGEQASHCSVNVSQKHSEGGRRQEKV